jgi:Prokaryotic cytochrome b561
MAQTISTASADTTIHPRWVRVCHWVNALAILVMIGSGWQIYNASPLFDFEFPKQITLGGWLAGALLWHFAAMWVVVINGIVYVSLGIVTGRFRRKLLPIRPGEVITDVKAALSFKLAHDDLSHYNAVQKLLYTGVIVAGIIIVNLHLETGAVPGTHCAIRRLRCRALRALPCHGRDCRLSRCARGIGNDRAEKPACHDHRTLGERVCANEESFPVSIQGC